MLKFKGLKDIEKEIPVQRAGRGTLNQNFWNKKKKKQVARNLRKGEIKLEMKMLCRYKFKRYMDPITYYILKYCLNSLYKCKKYTPRYHTWNVIMYNLQITC